MNWESALTDLGRQVETWAQECGLEVRLLLPPDPDEPLVEAVASGGTRIILEPARFSAGRLPAVAWLYAYPTLRRVRLSGPVGEAWEVQSSQGVPMNYRWDAASFRRLVAALADETIAPGA